MNTKPKRKIKKVKMVWFMKWSWKEEVKQILREMAQAIFGCVHNAGVRQLVVYSREFCWWPASWSHDRCSTDSGTPAPNSDAEEASRVNQDLPRDANPQSCTNYSSAAISRRAKIFRIHCSWYGSPTVLTHPPSFPGQPCNRENQKCLSCRRASKECLPCRSRVLTRSKGFQRSQTQDHWGLHRNQWAQL